MNITLENYAKILEESDEYNVIMKIGQEPNLKIFNAHSIILRAQSPYFHRALSREWRKEENGKILFEKPNVSPKIFEFILKYLYSGDINSLNNFNHLEFTDIIIAADEFILHDLVSHIEQKLIFSYNIWSKKWFVQIYKCVSGKEFCKDLQSYFEEKIGENPSIMLKSDDFTLSDEKMVIKFLKLENHSMKEIDVWNNVKRWGIAQIGNPETWTEEEFLELKETLKPCISFIRFSSITSDEFYEHVKPFRQIFPPDFYEDLLWKYIKNDEPNTYPSSSIHPSSSTSETKVKSYSDAIRSTIQNIQNIQITQNTQNTQNTLNFWNAWNTLSNLIQIDSGIIGNNHISLISRWISQTMNKSCHSFSLIMNSDIDGFSYQVFNRKCDEIRPTLVILTVEGTNEILGGFNPLRWGSVAECWKETRESFIFSFPSGQDHTTYRLSRPGNEKKAIYRSGFNGPNFGGGDLTLGRQTSLKRDCICIQTSYTVPIRDDSSFFRASSYEIFEVHIS